MRDFIDEGFVMPRTTLSYCVCALALAALAACGEDRAAFTPADPLTAQAMNEDVRILADDAFGGRAPGSPEEPAILEHITAQFEAAGLVPGYGEGWLQEVPLVSVAANPLMAISVTDADGEEAMSLGYGADMMAWTKRQREEVRLDASDLVFVGYGVVAPEYGWNDYEGLDVAGKTVVVLVNDPGYASEDPDLFNGRAMTYYGRWTYKFEEAARQGAAGALIVHETAPAAYPWAVVQASWFGPQFDVVRADDGMSRTALEGWITQSAAEALFARAGLDFAAQKDAALSRDFTPLPLGGLKASLTITNEIKRSTSHNVLGYLPGAERPDEVVIYSAHWDHLGRGPADDTGDGIFNGALDNATGMAALFELARAFGSMEKRPERTVAFLAVTAEEQGLLGSAYYADHPRWPAAETVANINMDGFHPYGPTRDITVVGYGASELDAILEAKAAEAGRIVEPEPEPEKGYYYRSDHFSFARVGVPALYTDTGVLHLERGEAYARAERERYVRENYHKPSDEWSQDWDLRGAVQDVELLFEVGLELARSEDWPNWSKGSEFKARRDESRAYAER